MATDRRARILVLALLIATGSAHASSKSSADGQTGPPTTAQGTSTAGTTAAGTATPGTAASSVGAATYAHAGHVTDASTGKDLGGVEATAYGDFTRDKAGLCPTYKKLLDKDTTKPNGTFSFALPSSGQPVYVVTYCHAAYATRTEASANRQTGTPVNPEPVYLFLRNGDSQAMAAALTTVGNETQQRVRDADRSGLSQLPAPERELVATWLGTDKVGSAMPEPLFHTVALVAEKHESVPRLLANFRATLEYLYLTNSKAFNERVTELKPIAKYVATSYLREEALRMKQWDDANTPQ